MQPKTLDLIIFLVCICLINAKKKGYRYVPKECRVEYSGGSLSEPCGFCHICKKELTSDNETFNHCVPISKWISQSYQPFEIAGIKKDILCRRKKYCPYGCKCDTSVEQECVNVFAACKCSCNEQRYGQKCQNEIPSDLSIESFADVKNIIYVPFIYSTDFAEFEVNLYSTGANLKIQVETERELLIFNDKSCKIKVISSEDQCKQLFKNADVSDYEKVCGSKPTYKKHTENQVCTLTINLGFARKMFDKWNKKQYVLDYSKDKNDFSSKDIVAKAEHLSISVLNVISNVSRQVFAADYWLMVIYKGKNLIEKCEPLVTIDQFSSNMFKISTFARKKEITVSRSVLVDQNSICETLGEPTMKWFVWIVSENHNEKIDLPIIQREGTSVLEFSPFSLWYGVYKVKHEVILNTNFFSRGISYCYFKIYPLPLDPQAFGGSLRYIYYKSNLELITAPLIDPNFPLNAQPESKCTWYCNDTSDFICQRVQANNSNNDWQMLVYTMLSPFTPGKTYNFTMEIFNSYSMSVEFSNQLIVVSPEPIASLLIECLRNCGGKNFEFNTAEIIYLRVHHSKYSNPMSRDSVYNWTFSSGNEPDSTTENIRQIEKTPIWILIINENALNTNQLYTFKVFGGSEPPGEAQMSLKASGLKVSDTLTCTISPASGIAGKTTFKINCTTQNDDNMSPKFTFYDKHNTNDPGRLLCSSYTGSAQNLILTRGQVLVSMTNMFGMSQETTVSVELEHVSLTPKLLKDIMSTLESLSSSQGYEQKVTFISAVEDILNKNTNMKLEVMDTFLKTINKEKVSDIVGLELLLSTTLSIICYPDDCSMPPVNKINYQYLVEVLFEMSTKLTGLLIETSEINYELTSSKVEKLYKLFLKFAGVLLSVQESSPQDKDYNVYKFYKYGNLKILKSLFKVNTGLAIRNLPYIKSTFVESETVKFYMKEDAPEYFTTKKGNSVIILSSKLADSLSKEYDTIVVQIMNLKHDPYWWYHTEQVTTEVLLLNIGYVKRGRSTPKYKDYVRVNSLEYPIDIFINKHPFTNGSIYGSVSQPDPTADSDVKDLAVSVHKLYPSKGSQVFVKFVDLSENDTFKVVILLNQRPDYDFIQEEGIIITELTPWCNFSREIINEEDVLFIGVLPGKHVLSGHTANYTFQLQTARCQVWHDVAWSTSGCKVGTESTEHQLHCQCNHLSSISGILKVPINTVNPFEDYKLFLTLSDNPNVFIAIASTLICYVILLIYFIKKDSQYSQKSNIIILEDNISSDLYGYLVVVCTGSRPFSGTSSNIGIILHGSTCKSRPHILRSSKRDTLKRGDDDWFLLYAPKYLGSILAIQLWTDHSGPKPNWFCDRIYIHDLESKDDFVFEVGQWFGVTQAGVCVEKYFRPIMFDKGSYFLINAISGFRENHMIISIIGAYPRSPMLKSQHLSITMVLVMVSLLTSIMFYDVAIPQFEDIPTYNISHTEVLISIYSLIIAAVATYVVALAFQKSYVKKKVITNNVQIKEHQKIQVDRLKDERITREAHSNLIAYYFHRVILSLRKKDFIPIKAAKDNNEEFKVHRVRSVLAWVLCMAIIITACFYIILYGLKFGKVKSCLWLTSTFMSVIEDIMVVDPAKIVLVGVLLSMVGVQFCDMYTYDPNIRAIRGKSNVIKNHELDGKIYKLKLNPFYKGLIKKRLKFIVQQQRQICKWWALVDVIDICFPAVLIYVIFNFQISGPRYCRNTLLEKMLFKNIITDETFDPSITFENGSEYLQYVENKVLPLLYLQVWYNGFPLMEDLEAFNATGWTVDTAHRMLGVPRLRQIRVQKEQCTKPTILEDLSIHCNVPFKSSTEDRGNYGTLWEGSSWDDFVFRKSPWTYHTAENSSSITTFGKSQQLFHAGGYEVELSRTQRKSENLIINLIATNWLDWRTQVIFLELTLYNVNQNVFSSIILITEFLESKLIMVDAQILSFSPSNDYIVILMLGYLYIIFKMIGLIMAFNTIGMSLLRCFWTLYDLILVLIGLSCLLGYRQVLNLASTYIQDFNNIGNDTFFQFQNLFSSMNSVIGSLMILSTVINIRLLRLIKYGNWTISKRLMDTIYTTWCAILWATSVLVLFLFVTLQLLPNLLEGFNHIQNLKCLNTSDNKVATYLNILSYCLVMLAAMLYKAIIVKGYNGDSIKRPKNIVTR